MCQYNPNPTGTKLVLYEKRGVTFVIESRKKHLCAWINHPCCQPPSREPRTKSLSSCCWIYKNLEHNRSKLKTHDREPDLEHLFPEAAEWSRSEVLNCSIPWAHRAPWTATAPLSMEFSRIWSELPFTTHGLPTKYLSWGFSNKNTGEWQCRAKPYEVL